jgi:tRNA A37 threonylcarbamoyladenosine synthetase subunit TsaC/SUA5/YrdC
MSQDQAVAFMKETQYAICVSTENHPAFPNLISVTQLLEILPWDNVQLLHQLEHPSHFLSDLRRQRIKEFIYGALSLLCPVEDEQPSHN